MKRPWSDAEIEVLRREFPRRQTREVAALLGCSERRVNNKAFQLRLLKTPEYLASPASGRLNGRDTRGVSARFKKGQPAWNKGVKGVVGVQEACRKNQFRKGAMPHNHKPVGYERVNADGYLERKVAEPKTFRGVHVLAWESVNGPVPAGHAVVFKPGRRSTKAEDITPDAVELVTRAELMRRNSYHRYPQPIPQLIQLRGALQRQINKRAKHEEQN